MRTMPMVGSLLLGVLLGGIALFASAAVEVTTGGKNVTGTVPAGDAPRSPTGAGMHWFTPPTGVCTLTSSLDLISDEARALIVLDDRLHEIIAPALNEYAAAAAQRRRLAIVVIPIQALDDQRPEQVRAALQSWHAAKPRLEGVLFVE